MKNTFIKRENIFKPLIYFTKDKKMVFSEIIRLFHKKIQTNPSTKNIVIDYEYFINLLPLDNKFKNDFPLVEILFSIQNRQIRIEKQDKNIVHYKAYSVISLFLMEENKIHIILSDQIISAIQMLSHADIENIDSYAHFKSTYSIIVYHEVINSDKNSLTLTMFQLRAILDLKANQYSAFADFKRVVLDSTVKDISATGYKLSYSRDRKNDTVTFKWKKH